MKMWTTAELDRLRALVDACASLKDIEDAFPARGKDSVRHAMYRRGLSLRDTRATSRDWPGEALAAYERHDRRLKRASAELGIGIHTLRVHLLAAGVSPKEIASTPAVRIRREDIEPLAAEGQTRREIAARLGVSYNGVCNACRRMRIALSIAPASVALPDLDELRSVLAQWGLAGVEEEWAVTEATARRWLEKLTEAHARVGKPTPEVFEPVRTSAAQERAHLLAQLVEEGLNREQIAERLGTSYASAAQALRTLGLKPVRKVYTRAEPEPVVQEGPRDWEELSDAIAQWGVAGAAEEYEVTEGQIMRWRMELCGEAI